MPTLHDYQVVARDFLRARDGAGLFLDMGLGKTCTTLRALEPRHLPVLVVAPKRVAETVWQPEAEVWRPDLRVVVAAGRPADRARALRDERADVVVLGRDNVGDVLDLGVAPRFRTLVLDELSGFKDFSSTRSRIVRRIVKAMPVRRVWGLTGTPSPNGLHELWPQVGLLDGGRALGSTKKAFKERYYRLHVSGRPGRDLRAMLDGADPYPPGHFKEWISSTHVDVYVPREGAAEQIHAAIADTCLSMATDGRITLPPVTRNVVEVRLPAAARRAYRDLKAEMVADLEMVGGSVTTASTAAHLTNRLAQVTAGALYPDDHALTGEVAVRLHHEKTTTVQEVVDGSSGGVLVFYRYLFERDDLLAKLPGAESMDAPDVIARWNRGEVPVLVAHPASAGHGLNLQRGGHTIVWTTLPWSLEEWQQANKRLARQGQQHPVVIHVLECPQTVDPLTLARLDGKAEVQGALLDHLESPL